MPAAKKGAWITVVAFFGGIVLIGIIDKLVPSFEKFVFDTGWNSITF